MDTENQELLTEVPKQLSSLAQIDARMFYQPEHIAIIDVLVHHQCVKEEELLELLLLDGKQLRQSLYDLKKDKIVQSIQTPETTEDGKICRFSYYYINYKVFVNTVKYKLDQMRKKIENEEKQMRNRTLYICGNCESSFGDIETDWLLDITGMLRCNHCYSELEETHNSSQFISMQRFNTLVKPVNNLLRETEDFNIPEIPRPSPQNISVLDLKGYSKRPTKLLRTTDMGINLYGEDLETSVVKVEIGCDNEYTERKTEHPKWMQLEYRPSVKEQSSSFDTNGWL